MDSSQGETFYWYDYETFGADPARDRAVQFAGLRTDSRLDSIAEPTVLYCRLSPDSLPQPDACLITGITPLQVRERGLCEADFMRAINAAFSVPGTCVVGYNNIRFDDEVTRYALYRSLMDPYAREWRNGNSRWDLIDVVRMAYALRPEGMVWPRDEEGRVSFKLERLTEANGLAHDAAHDALSDVQATIALARLLRDRQPRLFDFLLKHRAKAQAARLLALGEQRPLVHVSSRFPVERGCCAIVVALARDPANSNGIVCYDLTVDPEPLLTLEPEILRQRLFTPRALLPEGVERLPLKTVHLNKSPALAPLQVVRPEDAERLGLDLDTCWRHLARLRGAPGLAPKIQAIVAGDARPPRDDDPDLMLYRGFIPDSDRRELERLTQLSGERLAREATSFQDPRLPELLFRYRGRNFPESLDSAEQRIWADFCRARLTGEIPGNSLTLEQFDRRLRELEQTPLSDSQRRVVQELETYRQTLPL